MAEPRSVKSICRELGVGLGGQTRRAMGKWLDDSLFRMWELAVEQHGPEHAAALLFYVCQRDPSFKPPYWLMLAFKRHRAYIVQAFGDMRRDPTG